MLLTIVDTKSYGKFVLHLYPFHLLNLPKDDVTPIELTDSLTHAFEYFGIYQKSDVILTSTGSLKQGTAVDLFEANQKYTEIVMGIDENCVLVSKSSFLDSSKQFFSSSEYPVQSNQLAQFQSLNDSQSSIVNSISLVYRQQNYQNIEQVKHKLAFLVSALQIKQKHSKYLSKQVALIVQQKNQFKRTLKEKCAVYMKQNNTIYQEFKIKMIYKQIQAQALTVIKKIHVFELLQRLHNSWDKKQVFKPETFEEQFMSCINGINLKVPSCLESKQKIKLIENKTIITVPPKLNSLPSVFYPHQRVQYIYERLLSNNTKPMKNMVSHQLQISAESVYHTVYFLMKNDLSACVFPFDSQKYYSLYTLRSMPDKKVIQKFNSLFEGEDILQYLKNFQKYHRVKYLDEKVKYLILNKIIKEVMIFIQKLEPVHKKQQLKGFTSSIRQIKNQLLAKPLQLKNNTSESPSIFSMKSDVQSVLNQYVTSKPQQINTMINKCRQKNIKMSELINFVKHNSNYWKFIFVERKQ